MATDPAAPSAARLTQHTTAVVVYCPRCDYFRKIAVQEGSVGTHGCAECNGQMEVYVAYKGADHVHTR